MKSMPIDCPALWPVSQMPACDQNYKPPAWVSTIVQQLLESLSDQHVAGLSAVVLTESAQVRK
jgi:hypothetical protein